MDLQDKKSNFLVIGCGAAVAIIALVALAAIFRVGPFSRNQLWIHIENVGDMEFSSLNVSVTGGVVKLGSLLPGHKKESVLASTGESSVNLDVTDLVGEVHQFNVGGYIEPGFIGDIWVKMTHDRIVSSEVNISVR